MWHHYSPERRNRQAWIFFSPPGNSWHLDRVVLLTKLVKPTKAPQHFQPARIGTMHQRLSKTFEWWEFTWVSVWQINVFYVPSFVQSEHLSSTKKKHKWKAKCFGWPLATFSWHQCQCQWPPTMSTCCVHGSSLTRFLLTFPISPIIPSWSCWSMMMVIECSGRYVGYSWIDL